MESGKKYLYEAKAVAAHFQYVDGDGDFVPPLFSAEHIGEKEFDEPCDPDGEPAELPERRSGPREITFDHYQVRVRAYRDDAAYRTEATAWVTNLDIKGVLTARRIEASVITEYREPWYHDPGRPLHPRILPLPPVFDDLRIYGYPYTCNLRLPAPFSFTPEQRAAYLSGVGPDIEPTPIASDPDYPSVIATPKGKIIAVSADTRRIRVEDFGIVYFADWKWLPIDQKCCDNFQWLELLRFDLGNPGGGGVGGAGGGGSRPSRPLTP
jgi:hypothetical protein